MVLSELSQLTDILFSLPLGEKLESEHLRVFPFLQEQQLDQRLHCCVQSHMEVIQADHRGLWGREAYVSALLSGPNDVVASLYTAIVT